MSESHPGQNPPAPAMPNAPAIDDELENARDVTHDPNHVDHHAPTVARNARVGLWLFGVYVLLYGGFMALNAFYPQRMAKPAFAGVNLAITYGFVLIFGAFLLALLYMFLVRGRVGDREGL